VLSRGTESKLSETAELTRSISELLKEVRGRGDAALTAALARFDGVKTDQLRVSEEEIRSAESSIDSALSDAIDLAMARVAAFNEQIVRRATWRSEGDPGSVLGEIGRPIESVGLFVPSGKGSFPSVLVQIGVPAVTAKVADIQLVVPPMPGMGGAVDPATLVVASRLGITDIYRLNGPSGIGALAFGTETVRPVRKIVGPGSLPVALAQRLVQAHGCSIVEGLGPTDALIVADDSADIRLLAADVINEAEHGPDSSAVLVSTDRDLLEAAAHEIEQQLVRLPEPRQSYARTSVWSNGGLIHTTTWDQAMEVANAYAPEHIQIVTRQPQELLDQLKFAGTALVGQWTTFACSNFAIGTPATLPTTGFAKQTSGVTAHTFMNRISVAQIDEDGFRSIAGAVKAFAQHEGFPAHAASTQIRDLPDDLYGHSPISKPRRNEEHETTH